MLVLFRKVREVIRIVDDITVTVMRIAGNQVRLGIVAPPTTRVLRVELEATPPTPTSKSSPEIT